MEKAIHDVTLTFSPEIPNWPGMQTPTLERLRSMDEGGVNNLSRLDSHVHFGTHVDAPLHFVQNGYGMDKVPLEILLGTCSVVFFPTETEISVADLEAANIPDGTTRLVIRTKNSDLWDDFSLGFQKDFVALTPDAADWIVERGIKLVGIDYLSIERYEEPGRVTHLTLLGAEVVLVEGLDLRGIAPGAYELICMPLKLKDCDGSPARVALRQL
jgi:arylformamidase